MPRFRRDDCTFHFCCSASSHCVAQTSNSAMLSAVSSSCISGWVGWWVGGWVGGIYNAALSSRLLSRRCIVGLIAFDSRVRERQWYQLTSPHIGVGAWRNGVDASRGEFSLQMTKQCVRGATEVESFIYTRGTNSSKARNGNKVFCSLIS